MILAPTVKITQRSNMRKKLLSKSIISEKQELMVCRFGVEDSMVACGYSNGFVRVFNLNTSNKVTEINTNKGSLKTPVNCLRWRPNRVESNIVGNVLLVGNTDGNLYEYVGKTGKQVGHIYEQGNYIMAVDYSWDGSEFSSAGKDNVVRIYDQQVKKIKKELKSIEWNRSGHNNRVFCVKFKPDDKNLIATGGWDQNINIWDIREGKVVSNINGVKIAGDSIDFRDNLILTGAHRGINQLQLWDWRKTKLVNSFRWDEEKEQTNAFIFSCQFSKSDPQTVIAVGANQLKIFSMTDYSEIASIQFDKDESMYTVDTSLSDTKIVAGGKNGNTYYINSIKNYQ